jgi:peptidoglycan hydrolase-like protein with peptidoglycan-binding domain
LRHTTHTITILVTLLLSGSFTAAQQRTLSLSSALTSTQVSEAERRLSELGYWTGPIDGRFDVATRSALIAFQKWENRPQTGELTLEELEAIRKSTSPKARETGYEHVEVDVDRQLLLIVKEQHVVKVLPVSTGSGKQFVDDGQTSVAYTPRGRFIVYEKSRGWEYGPLGALYFANYISGGVAIHGSRNVPTQPETHGCIRVPVFAARELSKLMPQGTIVLVYDNISFVSGKPWAENPKLKQTASIE